MLQKKKKKATTKKLVRRKPHGTSKPKKKKKKINKEREGFNFNLWPISTKINKKNDVNYGV